MLIASAAPSLLVGLVAGVFVDRIDARRIMIAADLIRASDRRADPFLRALQRRLALHPDLLFEHGRPVLPLRACQPSSGGRQRRGTDRGQLVHGDQRVRLDRGGLCRLRLDHQPGFVCMGLLSGCALLRLVSAFCIWRVRPSEPREGEKTTVEAVVQNLRDGLNMITSTLVLRSFFLISIPIFVLVGLSNSLLLPFAHDELHASEFQYGLIEGIAVVGLTIGSLVMVRTRGQAARRPVAGDVACGHGDPGHHLRAAHLGANGAIGDPAHRHPQRAGCGAQPDHPAQHPARGARPRLQRLLRHRATRRSSSAWPWPGWAIWSACAPCS